VDTAVPLGFLDDEGIRERGVQYDWRTQCHEPPHLETYRGQMKEVKIEVCDWIPSDAGLRFEILHTPGKHLFLGDNCPIKSGHETEAYD
jgi:hypothetical protein